MCLIKLNSVPKCIATDTLSKDLVSCFTTTAEIISSLLLPWQSILFHLLLNSCKLLIKMWNEYSSLTEVAYTNPMQHSIFDSKPQYKSMPASSGVTPIKYNRLLPSPNLCYSLPLCWVTTSKCMEYWVWNTSATTGSQWVEPLTWACRAQKSTQLQRCYMMYSHIATCDDIATTTLRLES